MLASVDCPSLKQELALVLTDDRQPHESKAFVAAGDADPAEIEGLRLKSRYGARSRQTAKTIEGPSS